MQHRRSARRADPLAEQDGTAYGLGGGGAARGALRVQDGVELRVEKELPPSTARPLPHTYTIPEISPRRQPLDAVYRLSMSQNAAILQSTSEDWTNRDAPPPDVETGRVDQPVVLEEVAETWEGRNDEPLPAGPTLDTVAPTSGTSGTEFTLTGTGFIEGSVLAGTLSGGGANFTIVSPTSITVNLSGVADDYTVGITTADGTTDLLPVTLT